MLARIIRDFIGVPSAAPDEAQMDIDQQTVDKFENRSTFIQYIEAEYGLREAVLSNFKHYMLKEINECKDKEVYCELSNILFIPCLWVSIQVNHTPNWKNVG